MSTEWQALRGRIELRLIRVLDILSIMICDLVVIAIGYGAILLARYFSKGESKFFDVAKQISEGAFLLLYLIMVFADCTEFLKRESRDGSSR